MWGLVLVLFKAPQSFQSAAKIKIYWLLSLPPGPALKVLPYWSSKTYCPLICKSVSASFQNKIQWFHLTPLPLPVSHPLNMMGSMSSYYPWTAPLASIPPVMFADASIPFQRLPLWPFPVLSSSSLLCPLSPLFLGTQPERTVQAVSQCNVSLHPWFCSTKLSPLWSETIKCISTI